MASSSDPVLLRRPRHDFIWDERFTVRRLLAYAPEDTHLDDLPPQDPPENLVTAFLEFWASHLDPPDFNFGTLESFLGLAKLTDLTGAATDADYTRLVLIDDRRDPAGVEDVEQDLQGFTDSDLAQDGVLKIGQNRVRRFNGQRRDWGSDKYAKYPPEGELIHREVLDERELYQMLHVKVCHGCNFST